MSNIEQTPTTSTPVSADEQPTEAYGSTAVLTEPRPQREDRTPQYQAPQHPAPSGAAPVAGPTTPFSLTSLILGVTSVFFGLTVIAPVAGLIFGILGLRREPTGRTLAIWGIVLNSVMIGLVALFVIAIVAFSLLVPLVAIATGTDIN